MTRRLPPTMEPEADLPAAVAAAPVVMVFEEIPVGSTKSNWSELTPVEPAVKVIGRSTDDPAFPDTVPTVICGGVDVAGGMTLTVRRLPAEAVPLSAVRVQI